MDGVADVGRSAHHGLHRDIPGYHVPRSWGSELHDHHHRVRNHGAGDRQFLHVLGHCDQLGGGVESLDAQRLSHTRDGPGRPTGAVASAHANGESVVNWRAPTSDGGSVITGSTATATDLTAPRRGGQSCATIATTRYVIAGLTNGDRYRVSVTATNVVGTSSPSVMSAVVIPATVPGSPSRVVVSAVARGVLRVQWRAPSATNETRVTGYVVRAWPGGRTWHVSGSTTLRVASLNPRVTYVFTVAARNAAGTGTASTPSLAIAG